MVRELWRYPVKSMQGERVGEVLISERGVDGDREWAVALAGIGTLLSAKRHPALLTCSARSRDGEVVVTLPDRSSLPAPDAGLRMTELLGRDVEMVRVTPDARVRYDLPEDYATRGEGRSIRFPCPPGTFFDLGVVHVVGADELGEWDVRRFRPNLLVDTAPSPGELQIGDVRLSVTMATPRCVMTTREQGDLPRDREVLSTIARERDGNLGVYATVITPGVIREGAEVRP